MTNPRVWFERPIPAEFATEVTAQVDPLIPTSLVAEPWEHLSSSVGAVLGSLTFDRTVMESAPGVLVIARTGIGYDRVDISAATDRGIAVCNAPDGPTVSTAEHAMSLALNVAKSVRSSSVRLAAGEGDLYAQHRGFEFDGKTIGLIGCGRIARRVAQISSGFEMRVLGFDPYVDIAPPYVELCSSLADVLARSDIVSMHVPLSPETSRMCNAEFFSHMKGGAVFVNTARGGLVDQDALIAAVESGPLFGAGLDVTDPEPLSTDHPLLHNPAILVTPHVAAGTLEAKLGNFKGAFEGIQSVLAGNQPRNLVNVEVWSAVAERIEAAS